MTNVELTEAFLNNVKSIKEGYEIVDWEEDGNDDCGSLYWAFCKNGYSSRSYMIESEKKKAVSDYIKSVCDYGMSIGGGMPYYVNPKMMLEDVMSKDFQLVQISEEEQEEHFKEKEELIKVVEAYKTQEKANTGIKDWNNINYYHEIMMKENYEKRMTDLENVVLTNKEMFIKTVKKYVENSEDLLGRLK